MNITLEELQEINKVQIEIFREIIRVCDRLEIQYFMVHGSLLGTIRNEGFIPYDDDIDIAIPREQYEKFLKEAPSIIDENYFVQSNISDANYPLVFAKVRDNRTTYIAENVRNIDMNHGIYVDIFPLDYTMMGKLSRFKYKILNLRIGSKHSNQNLSVALKIKQLFSKALYPSYKRAVSKRNKLLHSLPRSDFFCMTGGKPCEKKIPLKWFSDIKKKNFEGMQVSIPAEYDKYLTHIYGDYEKRTLVEGKMNGDRVIINACIVDVQKPYTDYVKK